MIRDGTFFSQVMNLYQDPSFCIRKRPNVIFENEEGYDTDGLTRDFFNSALRHILDPANGLFKHLLVKSFMQLAVSLLIPSFMVDQVAALVNLS